jgi:hypothetical protein
MRKLIDANAMSLDGYYAGPDNNVMVLELDPAFDTYSAERLGAVGTLLLGRRSFDGFKSFWASVADPDPRSTAAQREVSRLDNAIDKVAVSDSLTPTRPSPGALYELNTLDAAIDGTSVLLPLFRRQCPRHRLPCRPRRRKLPRDARLERIRAHDESVSKAEAHDRGLWTCPPDHYGGP